MCCLFCFVQTEWDPIGPDKGPVNYAQAGANFMFQMRSIPGSSKLSDPHSNAHSQVCMWYYISSCLDHNQQVEVAGWGSGWHGVWHATRCSGSVVFLKTNKQTNKQKFKVRQPQRAARSKRPNTPSLYGAPTSQARWCGAGASRLV